MKQQNWKLILLCVGFSVAIIYSFCVTFGHIPKENREMANIILGVLIGTCIKDTYSYLFGSTQSSQNKDATIAASQENIKNALLSTPPQQETK